MKTRLCILPLVVAVFAATASGGERYGQLLRVPRGYAADELRSGFWKAIDAHPGAFTDLAMLSPWTDEVETLDFHHAFLPRLEKFVAEAKLRGYRVGVNILPSVAFPENYGTQRVARAQSRLTEKGAELTGTLCPRSQVTLDYVRELVAIYASAGLDFLYLDDDVDLAHCYCPGCQRRFEKLSGVKVWCSWDVRAALDSKDFEVRRKARDAWIELQDENRALVYAAAERGVHGVSPKIEVGCMTCNVALSDRAGARWTAALSGDSGVAVRWRPGGGCWGDQSRDGLMRKLETNVLQLRGVPAAVKTEAELECFPYHGLQKSSGFIGFEALAYVAWNCDSVAFNMLGPEPEALWDEFKPSLDKAQAIAPALAKLRAAFGETSAGGVGFAWGRYALTAPSRSWRGSSLVNRPEEFARIGIPTASESENMLVVLLDRDAAEGMSGVDVTNVLSRGVYLDTEALKALNRRGFGALTGFAIDGDVPRTAGFRDLEHPLNLPGRRIRRIRYSVSSGREARVPNLVKTDAKAEFTSELISLPFGGDHLGHNGGVFENALGGRVAVCTQLPYSECEGLPRAEHLKRVMRWLSHDTLPGYVHSFDRVALRSRGRAFYAANFACETRRNVTLAMRGGGKYDCTVFEGGEELGTTVLKPIAEDGAYSLYRIDELPNLGSALLVPHVETRTEKLREKLLSGDTNYVFVALHQGDHRIHPGNSRGCIVGALEMGADIIELDVRRTKDGKFILMHDAPADDLNTDDFVTLEEALSLTRGKMLVNIDKFDFAPMEILAEVKRLGCFEEVLIKSNRTPEEAKKLFGPYWKDVESGALLYMPVLQFCWNQDKHAEKILPLWLASEPRKASMYEVCVDKAEKVPRIAEVVAGAPGARLWLNGMWDDLNAGHGEAPVPRLAVGKPPRKIDPDAVWGWMLKMGASMIQTDNGAELIPYLERLGRHDLEQGEARE